MTTEIATTTERYVHPFDKFKGQIETRGKEIAAALPSGVDPMRFQRALVLAVQNNPDLLDADRSSLILACYKAAQDGLPPDGRSAALVIFNQRRKNTETSQWESVKLVQYMPMVYGLRQKILQSNEVVALEVGVVYAAEVEAGTFLYEVGLNPPLRHRPSFNLTEEDTTDDKIVGAYSIATMKDGTRSYELMRRFEINKVRQVSQTGAEGRTVQYGQKKGEAIAPKGPWVEWFAEMAKKTVMRRHSKTLPMKGDIEEFALRDVEAAEQEEAAKSAALYLASRDGGEPQAIEGQAEEEPHDPVTGEVIRKGPEDEERETEDAVDKKAGNSAAVAKADAQPETVDADADQRDELGVSADPNGQVADDLIAAFKAAATIIDLQALYARSELDRAAMSDEVHVVVQQSYEAEVGRLAKKAETANAARKARAAAKDEQELAE